MILYKNADYYKPQALITGTFNDFRKTSMCEVYLRNMSTIPISSYL